MKKRYYYPIGFGLKRNLIILAVSNALLVISIIVVLIVKDETLSILLPLPFGLVTFFYAVPSCIYETYLSNKKYEIHDNCIVSYEPLRKARKIDLDDLGSIYIVLHTMPGDRGRIYGLAHRDLDKRIIYDVILLKRGCPDHYIKGDASDRFFSSCKEYIMYDFDFNANTVLELLKRTKANVYTNKEMYDLMIKDRLFNEYKDKIVLTDLAHPPHMWWHKD